MSLSPENEKRLDRWLLGLAFAINESHKLYSLTRLDDETESDYQVRLFSTESYDQRPNEFGLDELERILRQIRYEEMVDANALFGLKNKRGGQRDFNNDRNWTIITSWIEAMRTLKIVKGNKTIDDFLLLIAQAHEHGWVKARGYDKRRLETRLNDFKSSWSTVFRIDGGIKNKTEQAIVDYLELQTRRKPNIRTDVKHPELVLWEHGITGIEPSDKHNHFQWAVERPEGNWLEASLHWSEHELTDGLVD
jgi:hypothetical protein